MLPGQSRSVETAVLQREWLVDGIAGHSGAETLALTWRETILTEPGPPRHSPHAGNGRRQGSRSMLKDCE